MNNKFGRDGRYREDRYREGDFYRDREARERFWRGVDEDRGLRSPDQEFETSGPYREPREPYGETFTRRESRQSEPAPRGAYDQGRFDGFYAPSYTPEWGADRYGRGSGGRGGFAGRGPKNYTRTDERIREDVCDRLSWHDEVDATDISVSVANGEVTLDGTVDTRHMKRLAEDISEQVPGVVDVHNGIRVKKPILTELKEKLTGEAGEHHYANTGTRG
jgi:hypothetical protein